MKSITLGDGVRLLCVGDERYQTAKLSVHFFTPLDKNTASGNALLVRILTHACEAYPDFTQLNRRLKMLYGAWVSGTADKLGEAQLLSVSVGMIDNRYVPDGGDVASACARLLCELIFRPALQTEGSAFRTEDVETERRQQLEELRGEFNDKRVYAHKRCEEEMFAGEPYGVCPDGTEEALSALTPEQLFDQWKALLETAQIVITAAGRLDAEKIAALFRGEFRQLVRRPQQLAASAGALPGKARELTERFEVSQAKLVIGFRTTLAEPDGNTMAGRLMSALFGGTPRSLLFLNVREKHSLCYYCMSRYDRQKGVVFVESGIEEKNAAQARDEIMAQLKVLQDGAFSDEELEVARRAVRDSFRKVEDQPSYLEEWYARQLLDGQMRTPAEAGEALAKITREEVTDAARRLVPDMIYLLAGKEKKPE